MPDLSPTARAMVQAFDARYELCGPLEDRWHEVCLAAALRVLADHVVPLRRKPMYADSSEESAWSAQQDTRAEILTLAAELAGEPTPTITEPHA